MESSFAGWPGGFRAALSLTFDDARPSQLDNGLPVFAEFGVKVTFYVSSAGVAARRDEWLDVVRDGHEIGNHTLNHPCSGNFVFSRNVALEDYTLARMQDEITGADRFIDDQLGLRPKTFAYPCGQTFVGRGRACRSYVPLVAERFLAGRGYRGESANDPEFCDLSRLDAAGCDNSSADDLVRLIDSARSAGAWLILCGHEIGNSDDRLNTDPAALRRALEYALHDTDIWIAPVAEVASHVRCERTGDTGREAHVQDW
ncbi:MAG: polysaccharide deacetylase [Spirochaetaceae bacterium]|nr:MAG: polysaccharide deacetylase [Spirochaetaceae bacterium]